MEIKDANTEEDNGLPFDTDGEYIENVSASEPTFLAPRIFREEEGSIEIDRRVMAFHTFVNFVLPTAIGTAIAIAELFSIDVEGRLISGNIPKDFFEGRYDIGSIIAMPLVSSLIFGIRSLTGAPEDMKGYDFNLNTDSGIPLAARTIIPQGFTCLFILAEIYSYAQTNNSIMENILNEQYYSILIDALIIAIPLVFSLISAYVDILEYKHPKDTDIKEG